MDAETPMRPNVPPPKPIPLAPLSPTPIPSARSASPGDDYSVREDPASEAPRATAAHNRPLPLPLPIAEDTDLPRNGAFLPRNVEAMLASPGFYRWTGRVCACLSVLSFLVLLIVMYWHPVSLAVTLLFAAMFFIGEAAATIIEKLERFDANADANADAKASTGPDDRPTSLR